MPTQHSSAEGLSRGKKSMTWFSRPPDRRASPRFRADVPLTISVVDDHEITSVHALGRGISEGGVSVVGIQGLTVGGTVSLEMHLPVANQPLWVEAVVRHTAQHCGLEFLALSEEQQRLIKRYCRWQPQEKRQQSWSRR